MMGITERDHAEELRLLIAHALESVREIVSITDLDDRFTFVNQAFLDTYGYTRDEVLGQHVSLIASPNNPPGLHSEVLAQSRTGGWKGELLNRTKAGREFPIALSTSCIRDGAGKILGLVGIAEDITPRRQATEALVARTRQLEAIRVISEEITRELDLPTLLGLIHRRAAELVGAESGAVYLWDEAAQVLIPRAWHGAGEWLGDVRLRLGEGVAGTVAERREGMVVNDYRTSPYRSPLFLERTGITATVAEPLLYRDRLVGVITINNEGTGRPFMDQDRELLALFATQAAIAIENARLHEAVRRHADELEARVRERTAELEEALGVKAQFLANMSHELRTPLNAVLGFSEVLLGRGPGDLTSKQERYLQQIHHGGKRLLELVTDLLEMTEAQTGPAAFRMDRLAVSGLFGEVLGPLTVAARAKRVELGTTLDPGLPTVVADRRKLAQILHHVVTNAIRYTPAGGRITVGARRIGTPEGEEAEIAVADTGLGIRAEDLERIFRGFEQVDASDSRQYGGAGLGLALVRRLAELHGGRVWAESEGEGRGARFIVRLPLLAAPPAKRILIVEDEAPVLEALGTALTAAGYLVDRAPTGAEALDRLAATPPSLLVLDIGLPDVDGWEVLRQVRRTEQTRDLPILVLTGLEHVHADQALALGADEFLAKPVSAQVLVETVGRLLMRPAREAAPEGHSAMSPEEKRELRSGRGTGP